MTEITTEQIAQYERDGILTLDTPITEQEIADASDLFDELLPLPLPEGDKPVRHRVGRNYCLEPPLIRILEKPFFEEVAKQLLHCDAVEVVNTAIRKTHPEPGAKFEVGEHTDIIYALQDLESVPRRIDVGFFIWIADVDGDTAPLMVRRKSHRQIAEHMGDQPQYIQEPWDKDEYVNVPDAHTVPMGNGAHREQWPDLDYGPSIPCVAKAGQMTVLNPAAIHGASTNVGSTARKSLFIGFRPKGMIVGESKGRREGRKEYMAKFREVLSPGRKHIAAEID